MEPMFGPPAATTPTDTGRVGDGAVDAQLEAIRGKYRLPVLIGASFGADSVHEVGVARVRALGRAKLATVDDAWHIGSLTKCMTALLAALMVERGRIAWTTTIADSFSDLPPAHALCTVPFAWRNTHAYRHCPAAFAALRVLTPASTIARSDSRRRRGMAGQIKGSSAESRVTCAKRRFM